MGEKPLGIPRILLTIYTGILQAVYMLLFEQEFANMVMLYEV